jgi:hypothetical protein
MVAHRAGEGSSRSHALLNLLRFQSVHGIIAKVDQLN